MSGDLYGEVKCRLPPRARVCLMITRINTLVASHFPSSSGSELSETVKWPQRDKWPVLKKGEANSSSLVSSADADDDDDEK